MKYKDKEYKLCIECKHCSPSEECDRKEYVDVVNGTIHKFQCSTERSSTLDDALANAGDKNICGRDGKYWEAK